MHEGYHSIMASNGQEALARLAYVQADAVITDLDMPEMDGVELVRRLARTPQLSSIPVIVLTAIDPDDARDRLGGLASHVRLILRKPVKLGSLLQAVATFSSAAAK